MPHTPRRLKGRLEVRRELPFYPQTSLYCWLWQQRTLCIGTQHCIAAPRALHCIAGRVERWATLAPPSFVIIARSARSASGVLHLEKSVISCSTAPLLHSSHFFPAPQLHHCSTAPNFFPAPKPPTSLPGSSSHSIPVLARVPRSELPGCPGSNLIGRTFTRILGI